MDIFSIPEMTLLAVANDYFITNDIEYDPVHLFKDVSVSEPPILTVTNVTPFFSGCVTGVFFLELEAQGSAELSQVTLVLLWVEQKQYGHFGGKKCVG